MELTEQELNNEVWKDIKGYEGLYQVSNMGRVKSVARTVTWKNQSVKRYKERIMKTRQKQGYASVCLFKDDIRRDFKVHRLVAEAFISNPNNLPFINHIDENKLNNKVENLEWCSREYNNNYGQRNGKISMTQKKNSLLKMVSERSISLDGNKYISIPILQELIEDVYSFYG